MKRTIGKAFAWAFRGRSDEAAQVVAVPSRFGLSDSPGLVEIVHHSEQLLVLDCDSAWKIAPLRWGIGVQN